MTQHIQLGTLADYVMEGKTLDVSSLEHLESCPDCRSDILWLRELDRLRRLEEPKTAVEPALETLKKDSEAA